MDILKYFSCIHMHVCSIELSWTKKCLHLSKQGLAKMPGLSLVKQLMTLWFYFLLWMIFSGFSYFVTSKVIVWFWLSYRQYHYIMQWRHYVSLDTVMFMKSLNFVDTPYSGRSRENYHPCVSDWNNLRGWLLLPLQSQKWRTRTTKWWFKHY